MESIVWIVAIVDYKLHSVEFGEPCSNVDDSAE